MRRVIVLLGLLATVFALNSCTVQKKRGEVGKLGKLFHNTTAKFNGYFNADVIMQESEAMLASQYQDNYNKVLPIYPYTETRDAKAVAENLDKAIEKVSIVATIHEPSQWVDDCYVLLGKAQYLKQDYEAAEKTFEFFVEEFNPLNKRKSRLKKNADSSRKKKARTSTRRPTAKKKRPAKKQRPSIVKKRSKPKKDKRSRPGSKKRKSRPGSKKRPAKPGSKERPEKTDSPTGESEDASTGSTSFSDSEANENAEDKSTSKTVRSSNPPNSDPKKVVKSAEKDGMFGHKPVYQEGILWLARTYIHRERFSLAQYYLEKVEGDPGTPKSVQREVPVVRAFYHIKKKEYNEAIAALTNAASLAKTKQDRARYTFIIAQLHQAVGRQDKAFDAYNAVINMHPDYEMEFNAELNLSKAAWASGQENATKTIERLEKMAKEEKNFDYRDQIYFTMGTINLKLRKRDVAIENFRASIRYNIGNSSQSAESYYVLATYFYEEEEYADAKYHYDSTLLTLPKSDERYDDVKRKSENLKEIATNISIIELQDSLLRVSEMSPERQREIAAAIKKKKEMMAKPAASIAKKAVGLGAAASAMPVSNGISAGSGGAKKSSFFAYDLNKIRRGQNEFRKVWGNRSLEDDWRRSNKVSGSITENTSEKDIAKRLTDDEIKSLLGEVPFNPKDKAIANSKIEEAYFNLGKLYRSKLEQADKSAEALDELYKRNEASDFREEAYYFSYLSYTDLSNISKANYFKEKLVKEFPYSKYTLSITDPNYAATQLNEEKKLQRQYDEAYEFFAEGNYQQSKEMLDELAKVEDDRIIPLMPKIDLLLAMTEGNLSGQDAYITQLNYVVKKHPNTPEETRAKEILRFIKGDKQAFDPILYNESGEDFTSDPAKLHYVLVVLYSKSSKDMTSSKIDISTFNQKNFKDQKLKISSIYLNKDDGSQIILIRRFKDQDEAMTYYLKATGDKEAFINSKEVEYEVFAVTQKSYREIVKQKSANAYRDFFKNAYLTD